MELNWWHLLWLAFICPKNTCNDNVIVFNLGYFKWLWLSFTCGNAWHVMCNPFIISILSLHRNGVDATNSHDKHILVPLLKLGEKFQVFWRKYNFCLSSLSAIQSGELFFKKMSRKCDWVQTTIFTNSIQQH